MPTEPTLSLTVTNNITPTILGYNQSFQRALYRFQAQLQQHITEFNKLANLTTPIIIDSTTTHKALLQSLDQANEKQYYAVATVTDARLKTLSLNGATAWLNSPPNELYGIKFNNQQFYTILSLYLVAPLIPQDTICKKCGKISDKHGYHALSCPSGPHTIKRHNTIRNEINCFLKRAGYITAIEMKFDHNPSSNAPESPVTGIPGDIKVQHWFDNTYADAYLDIVVANVFAPSYLTITSEKRGALAKQKEMDKKKKYNNNMQCIPLAIEVMGGMGIECKKVFQKIAHRIATRKNKSYSDMMSRMRQHIVATLMQQNTNMILSSLEL